MCETIKKADKTETVDEGGEVHRWPEYNRYYQRQIQKTTKALEKAAVDLSSVILKYGSKSIYNRKDIDGEIGNFLFQFAEDFFRSLAVGWTLTGAMMGQARYYIIARESESSTGPGTQINFDEQNPTIANLLKFSLERVRTVAFKENQEAIRKLIIELYLAGKSDEEIARAIRRVMVDEPLYKYKRLIRSEVQLASDSAIVAQARADGASGVQWKTSLRPCPVCQPLHNLIWLPGENPRVIYDTHPSCLCNVVPVFRKLKPEEIQPAWNTEPQWAYRF